MRPGVLAGSVVILSGIGLTILIGGRALIDGQQSEVTMADQPPVAVSPKADKPLSSRLPPAVPDKPEPSTDTAQLERIAPREPLGNLGLASPPKPKNGGPTLYQPLSPAAGKIEAMGYSILLAGVEPLDPEETCDFEGRTWPCGARARSAFRAFLRGRAVTCKIAPEAQKTATITTTCRLGRQDISEWLAENGWARAVAGGPYAKPGDNARSAGKGIYGPPPAAAAPPAPLPTPSAMPADPSGPFQ
ncbi:MAG: thermonuclease family protein [Pseudaminobacter sp.]